MRGSVWLALFPCLGRNSDGSDEASAMAITISTPQVIINVTVQAPPLDDVMTLLTAIRKEIRMDKDQLAAALEGIGTQLSKATKEIVDAIAASGNSTPRIDAAVAGLTAAAQALDDLNPDAPPPAP